MTSADWPLFSVIIPTRNRASSFAVALASVLEQRFRRFEVIVVDDGSSDEQSPLYREILRKGAGTVKSLTLVQTERGHGPSFTLNYGVSHARGSYLCFLDDDDQWTDPAHLERAACVIEVARPYPDLILGNQRAFRNGAPLDHAIWIEDLQDRLRRSPDVAGAYSVTTEELLRCQAHCHRNTTIVSRSLYLALGGLDEALRYEEDRDFYLRAIDRADSIMFLPATVSRHNIPNPAEATSSSTSDSELAKRLYQLRVLDKAILFAARPELRRYAMRHRVYTLRHIVREAAGRGQFDRATYYAYEALAAKLSLGWLAVREMPTVLWGRRSVRQS